MTIPLWKATCAVIVGSLLAFSAQAALVNIYAKVTASGTYAVEVEIADFSNASSIDLVNAASGRIPLIFDSGEANWDVEAEDLTLSDLGAFFSTTFDLEILHSGGQSIYQGESLGALPASAFPVPASSLTVDDNPTPTAQWTGGDDTTDAQIISYASGDDEFSDGFDFSPEEDSSQTLSFALDPGFYEVALGFYFFLEPGSLTLLTGDDVLGVSDFNIALVGETFTDTTVVPVPAAFWLFGSALGLLGWMKRRNS